MFCPPCTVKGKEPRLAPGVHVCIDCQMLFRGTCKNLHHMRCGGYKGAPPSQARKVDFDRDKGKILKALGQFAAAQLRIALRPFKSRLARAKVTDGGATLIVRGRLDGLLAAAQPGSDYHATLTTIAHGFDPDPSDQPVDALGQAWARDHRREDARGSCPPSPTTSVAAQLGQHLSVLGDLPALLAAARARA